VSVLVLFGKLEASLDERKPEAYATTWWHLQEAPAGDSPKGRQPIF